MKDSGSKSLTLSNPRGGHLILSDRRGNNASASKASKAQRRKTKRKRCIMTNCRRACKGEYKHGWFYVILCRDDLIDSGDVFEPAELELREEDFDFFGCE